MRKILMAIMLPALICISMQSFAQVPDQAQLEKLQKMAQSLQGLTPEQVRQHTDSILKIARQMRGIRDSVKDDVVHQVAKEHPHSAQMLAYDPLERGDTSYVSITAEYHSTRRGWGDGGTEDITLTAHSDMAPMITRGKIKTIVFFSNTLWRPAAMEKLKLSASQKKYMQAEGSLKTIGEVHANYSSKCGGYLVYNGNVVDTTLIAFTFVDNGIENFKTAGFGGTIEAKGGEKDCFELNADKVDIGVSAGSADASDLTKAKIAGAPDIKHMDADAELNIQKTEYGYTITGDRHTESTDAHFTARIGGQPQQWEAVIMPVERDRFSFRRWLPSGPNVDGSNDRKGDDSLRFKVVVRDKKDTTKLYNGNFQAQWELRDVTKYPGFCNNYPKFTNEPDTNPDLLFDSLMVADPDFDAGTTTSVIATTKQIKGAHGEVHVICMDYAAWGKLKVTVIPDDGSAPIVARSVYAPGVYYMTIPYDTDENKLADAWEKQNGVLNSGHPLTWDEDRLPEKQMNTGDGYTLFEEYRGFAVHKPQETSAGKKDVFVRTDPSTKDAFVYDQDDLFQKYYEVQNPAKLNWHYLSKDKGQLYFLESDKTDDRHRWVNFNEVKGYTYFRQYCLVLRQDFGQDMCEFGKGEDGSTPAGVTFGIKEFRYCHALPPVAAKDEGKSPVKNHIETVIYLGRIDSRYGGVEGTASQDSLRRRYIFTMISTTVRHEVGHYLGISHHHTSPNPDKKLLESDGVSSCLMRAFNGEENFNPEINLTEFNRYCRANEPGFYYTEEYVLNPDGSRKKDKKGNDVTRLKANPYMCNDNCWGQIAVKCNPGE